MKRFSIRVHAAPGDKVVFEGPKPVGYYQRLGVTVRDERDLMEFVKGFVARDLGGTVLEIDDIEVPNLDDEEWTDSEFCGDINSLGVWYASGCAFYFEDGDEDDDGEEELPN